MRRLATAVLAGGLAVAAVLGLMEATQNRPDPVRTGTATRLTLEVRTRGGYPTLLGAGGLWGMCQQTVSEARLAEPLVASGTGRVVLVVTPSLGSHAARRLRGCLEDATVPRVSARLVGRQDVVAART